MLPAISLTLLVLLPQSELPIVNPVAVALSFAHEFGRPAVLSPGKARALNVKLITSVSEDAGLPWDAELFDQATFQKATGDTKAVSLTTMAKLVNDSTPQSRKDMNAKTRLHADLLATQFNMIDEIHREPAERLVSWIVKNYEAGKPLGVIIICTGNTRRSMLGATMGNIASAYYGLPNIRFSSGGTNPVAFNPRTISTLKEIGVEIEPTGKEAPRGTSGQVNPIYSVKWGKDLKALEFSKKYNDALNPQSGFAALMVCSEADASCPNVTGASIRISVPYLDPKAFDGAPFESGKYAERRDDIGRFMLSVMMQSRRKLAIEGKLK